MAISFMLENIRLLLDLRRSRSRYTVIGGTGQGDWSLYEGIKGRVVVMISSPCPTQVCRYLGVCRSPATANFIIREEVVDATGNTVE